MVLLLWNMFKLVRGLHEIMKKYLDYQPHGSYGQSDLKQSMMSIIIIYFTGQWIVLKSIQVLGIDV